MSFNYKIECKNYMYLYTKESLNNERIIKITYKKFDQIVEAIIIISRYEDSKK
jgi:hypothetical protein